jgi:hypothetical protein
MAEARMEYRYKGDVKALQGKPSVGDGECVRIVQHYAKAPRTPYWRPGRRVLDAVHIQPGTAIATFRSHTSTYVNAKGNHAALFMYAGPKDANGKPLYIVVMDQWKGRPIKARTIKRYSPEEAAVLHIYDSDNAETFYVIQ